MRVFRSILARSGFAVGLRRALIGLAMGFSGIAANAESVAVVAGDSGIRALGSEQIADIFLGRMRRLPDGQPVTPIDQAEGTPTRDAFYALVTGRSPAQVKGHWAKIIFTGRGEPPRQVASCEEVKKLVAGDPNAIGYIETSAVDDTVRVLDRW